MVPKSTQNHQSPPPLPTTPADSISLEELEPEPSTTGNAPCGLPLRVRELRPSTRHLKERASQQNGVRKRYQRVVSGQFEKDLYPLHEVTIETHHFDEETFGWDVKICKHAQQVRHPQCIASQFISSDLSTGTIVVREPVIKCAPFYRRTDLFDELNSATLKQIKKAMRAYVELLYRLGVGYNVTAQDTYVLRTERRPGWVIHFRNVMYSDFCDKPLWATNSWDVRERIQYERIERMFEPIEMSVAGEEDGEGLSRRNELADNLLWML
jgi:hypothetical protein